MKEISDLLCVGRVRILMPEVDRSILVTLFIDVFRSLYSA